MTTPANPFRPGARYVPPQETFVSSSARPDVRFLSQAVQPPSVVYVEQTDVLRIAAASSQANESLTVSWRLLLPNGDIVLNQASLAVPATRTIAIHDEPMAEGFLLSVSCRAATATTRGQTFARIFLTDPDLGAGQPSYMLMADYVTTAMAPSHPNGRVLAPSEGPGNIIATSISNPLPGAEWTITVPTNARWRLMGLRAIFTTDATVGSRNFRISTVSGGNVVWQVGESKPNAGITNQVYMGPGATRADDALTVALNADGFPYPIDNRLLTGAQIGSLTTFVGPADAWTAISAYVEEWLDNV